MFRSAPLSLHDQHEEWVQEVCWTLCLPSQLRLGVILLIGASIWS